MGDLTVNDLSAAMVRVEQSARAASVSTETYNATIGDWVISILEMIADYPDWDARRDPPFFDWLASRQLPPRDPERSYRHFRAVTRPCPLPASSGQL